MVLALLVLQACLSDLERERDKVTETLKKMKDDFDDKRVKKLQRKAEMHDQGKLELIN